MTTRLGRSRSEQVAGYPGSVDRKPLEPERTWLLEDAIRADVGGVERVGFFGLVG
jgi:hypothetical protein